MASKPPVRSWQEIIRDDILRRRMHLHGPLYWTGWLFLKIVSRGKYPNDDLSDVPATLIGMVIWLAAFVAVATYATR